MYLRLQSLLVAYIKYVINNFGENGLFPSSSRLVPLSVLMAYHWSSSGVEMQPQKLLKPQKPKAIPLLSGLFCTVSTKNDK